jgi:hypothetical protein
MAVKQASTQLSAFAILESASHHVYDEAQRAALAKSTEILRSHSAIPSVPFHRQAADKAPLKAGRIRAAYSDGKGPSRNAS